MHWYCGWDDGRNIANKEEVKEVDVFFDIHLSSSVRFNCSTLWYLQHVRLLGCFRLIPPPVIDIISFLFFFSSSSFPGQIGNFWSHSFFSELLLSPRLSLSVLSSYLTVSFSFPLSLPSSSFLVHYFFGLSCIIPRLSARSSFPVEFVAAVCSSSSVFFAPPPYLLSFLVHHLPCGFPVVFVSIIHLLFSLFIKAVFWSAFPPANCFSMAP